MIDTLESEADEHGKTRSEYIRDMLATRHEHADVRDEYEARIEELKRENERLKNEKRLILEQREENTELARYIEDELSYREAGLGTRMKWWLFGRGEE